MVGCGYGQWCVRVLKPLADDLMNVYDTRIRINL